MVAMMMNKSLVLFCSWTWLVAEAFVAPTTKGLPRQSSSILVDDTDKRFFARHERTRDWSLQVSKVDSPPPTWTMAMTTKASNKIQLKSYNYDGYKLTYLYKPASSAKYRNAPPMLLIHPVGIGMSSWFWERFMDEEGPAMYAVDLIGCGLNHGADAWDPNERGMSVPLAWVKACEALMQEQVLSKAPVLSSLPFASTPRYTVVAQGGLAPVGVLLTARNLDTVNTLVLTSPPTDLTTPVTEKELARNYGFFTGRFTAPVAFGLLETRRAVKFFSNLFLFENPCDDEWLDQAEAETCEAARPPVQVFNAGFCQARSYQPELQAIVESPDTRVLVLQGQGDTPRNANRQMFYEEQMGDSCRVVTLPGKNVLPWEFPRETLQAILDFVGQP